MNYGAFFQANLTQLARNHHARQNMGQRRGAQNLCCDFGIDDRLRNLSLWGVGADKSMMRTSSGK
jgi:hypothetical protein